MIWTCLAMIPKSLNIPYINDLEGLESRDASFLKCAVVFNCQVRGIGLAVIGIPIITARIIANNLR